METLDATISRVIHHKPAKWAPAGIPFLIARCNGGQTIKGKMRKPVIDSPYRFYGEWMPQKQHDSLAFEFVSYATLIDRSANGIADYLADHIDGIGQVKAEAIVETFGIEALDILRASPDRVVEVPGLKEKHIEAIRKHFEEDAPFDPAAYAKLIDLFSGHKFPKKLVELLLTDWESDAPAKVLESPYMLLAYPRMGWAGVDGFATSTAGYDPAGIDRQAAAISEALERIGADGHTIASEVDVEIAAFGLVSRRPSPEAWQKAIDGGMIRRVEIGPNAYSLAKIADAENEIAAKLADQAEYARPLGVSKNKDGGCPLDPTAMESTGRLNGEQASAVRMMIEKGVSILAGGPGTGKTYTLTTVIGDLIGAGYKKIRIVAPTGKAAKRAAELLAAAGERADVDVSGIPATTIHKALLPVPNDEQPEGASKGTAKIGRGRDGFRFGRNENAPFDDDLIIADETSMIDCSLMASLLRAIPPGCRLILVGDPNQLPSVGPGSVLRDLIAAGIPTTTLTEIRRSAGRIVRACHAIKDGIEPEPSKKPDLAAGKNWIHIEESEPEMIAARIVELHKKYPSFPDPIWDLQVVSAQKAKPMGCDNLNRLLSPRLNPPRGEASFGDDEDSQFGPRFRVGDKVIRKKNGVADGMTELGDQGDKKIGRADWTWNEKAYKLAEVEVVNGDMGIVEDIVDSPKGAYVVVRFRLPDRLCRVPIGDCHLQLAYAITCHSAQGSGFPYVIVPVHKSFYWDAKSETGLFNRELLYTAISRAEKLLVTVGQWASIRAAISRKTVNRRRTRLEHLVRSAKPREVKSSEIIKLTAPAAVTAFVKTPEQPTATSDKEA